MKENIDDTISENIDWGLRKSVRIYIRENRVSQYDSIWPWVSPTEYSFYSVSNVRRTVANLTEDYDQVTLVEYLIAMDSQIDIYERRVYTILDVFSDIGGIFEIFHLAGLLLVVPFNKKAFKIWIVNEMKSKPSLQKLSRKKTTAATKKRSRILQLPVGKELDEEAKKLNYETNKNPKENTIGKNIDFNYCDIFWMSIPGLRCLSKTNSAKDHTFSKRIATFESINNHYISELD